MKIKRLASNVQLFTAANDGRVVNAYIDDELVGTGIIESITDVSVKIGGEYFLRTACSFTR